MNSLLPYLTDSDIIKIEKQWIVQMKKYRGDTGLAIYSPFVYLDSRVYLLNLRLKDIRISANTYINWINAV